MMVFLFIFFIVMDIVSLFVLSSWIGLAPVVLWVIVFFVIGFLMFRSWGLAGMLLLFEIFRSRDKISLYQILWPLRYSVVIVLFLFPGILGDIVGLILLLPFRGKSFHNQSKEDNIIDVKFKEID